jgi:uncharacterized protein YwqG
MHQVLRDRLIQEFANGPLAAVAAEIVALSEPAARIAAVPHRDRLPIGASRLAGGPDLPEAWAWPETSGRPLAFLAQIDLSELPLGIDWPVPSRGFLYVFLEDDEPGSGVPHRVLHFAGERHELRSRPLPEGRCEPAGLLCNVPLRLTFDVTLMLPELETIWAVPSGEYPMVTTGTVVQLPEDRTYEEECYRISQLPEFRFVENTRMFGGPSSDDQRFEAIMWDVGFGEFIVFAPQSIAEFESRFQDWRAGDPERALRVEKQLSRFAEFKSRQQQLLIEARHWTRLLEVGSLQIDKGSEFLWWDAGSIEILGDRRKMQNEDFSGTYCCIHSS